MKKRSRTKTFTKSTKTLSSKKRKKDTEPNMTRISPKKRPKTRRLHVFGTEHVQLASGDRIEDRGSVFVAHVAFPVTSRQHADAAVSAIRRLPELQSATHNIAAYRLGKKETFKDDDGEKKAGGKLLTMLNKQKVLGAVVVVSRWYGGQNLGPVRFKHITGSALKVLQTHGMKANVVMGKIEWGEGHRLTTVASSSNKKLIPIQDRKLAMRVAAEKRIQGMIKGKPKMEIVPEEVVQVNVKPSDKKNVLLICPVCSSKWETSNELNGHLDKCLS